MHREEMMEMLRAHDKADRLPMWIISYNRAGSAPTLERMKHWERQDDIFVVVREEQRQEYRRAYPEMTIIGLPAKDIGSCGAARWGAFDAAYDLFGMDRVTMLDDDVLQFGFLCYRESKKGEEASGTFLKSDEAALPDLHERVLGTASTVAVEVFNAHPRTMFGGPIKRHMSFAPSNHRTKYALNSRVTPRQVMFWELDRMTVAGCRLNLDDFGIHGEDLGNVDQVLSHGGDVFALPSFIYDHWPEEINIHKSMIRNPQNAAALHAQEWETLQRYPIKDYLRVKRSMIDGSYEWGDVNWKALHKIRGTEPVTVLW